MIGSSVQSLLGKPSGTFVALVYAIFGFADMGFSLLAFRLGISEGNPVLAWMGAHGLFIPAKLFLTVLAAALIGVLYAQPRTRLLCWGCILLMVIVDAYHIVALIARVRMAM